MTSARKKGQQFVLEAMEVLEAMGFHFWHPCPKAHFIGKGRVVSQSQDIFECSDFVAVHSDCKVLFVQVTTESGSTSHAQERMRKFSNIQFPPEHSENIVMARIHGKKHGFRYWVRDFQEGWEETSEHEFRLLFDYSKVKGNADTMREKIVE